MTIATPLARNSDPITSHAAADQAQAMRKQHHAAILGALRTGPWARMTWRTSRH